MFAERGALGADQLERRAVLRCSPCEKFSRATSMPASIEPADPLAWFRQPDRWCRRSSRDERSWSVSETAVPGRDERSAGQHATAATSGIVGVSPDASATVRRPCYRLAHDRLSTRCARRAHLGRRARFRELVREAGSARRPTSTTSTGWRDARGRSTRRFGGAPHLVAYAVKANSAGTVVRDARRPRAPAPTSSRAPSSRWCSAPGIPPARIVMSGVAKADGEIDLAHRARHLHAIQAESVEELDAHRRARRALGAVARVALRINPGVEIDTHAHIATGHDEAKFGIALARPRRGLGRHRRASRTLVARRRVESRRLDAASKPTPYLRSARARVRGGARAASPTATRSSTSTSAAASASTTAASPRASPGRFVRAALALAARARAFAISSS